MKRSDEFNRLFLRLSNRLERVLLFLLILSAITVCLGQIALATFDSLRTFLNETDRLEGKAQIQADLRLP